MNKVGRLQRVLRLLTLLQSDLPLGPQDLARTLGVSCRTIYRDIELLDQAGFHFLYDEQACQYLPVGTNFPRLDLNSSEIQSLILAANHLGRDKSVSIAERAVEAVTKLLQWLPQAIRRQGILFSKYFSTPEYPRATPTNNHIFTQLQQAMETQNLVQLCYIPEHAATAELTTFSPYHLRIAGLDWHVIGYSTNHQKIVHFSGTQIEHIRVLSQKYVTPDTFHVQQFLKNAWTICPEGQLYYIRLLFKPSMAHRLLKVCWHRTQKLTRHPDGSITFEAHVDGLHEITWWIIGFGDQVEVLGPAVLRQRIAQITQKMASLYQNNYLDNIEELKSI